MRSTVTSDHPRTRKGCSTVIYGIILLVGLVFLAALGMAVINTARPYFWDKTPCTILDSQRAAPGLPKPKNSDGFLIRYRYEVDGAQYTSTQFTKGAKESLTTQKIERLLRQYRTGMRSVCYVDPRNPREAILQRGPLWIAFFALIPLLVVAVGVGGLMATYSTRPPAAAAAARRSRTKKLGAFGLPLFFGLFAVVGGALSYFLVLRTAMKYLDARSWPEVPCEIVSSSVGSHRSTSDGRTSTTYSVDVTYRYRFDGSDFVSDQYEIFGGSSSGYDGKAATVARYPAGSRSVCYVNPKDPTEALLDRSPSAIWLVGLIPLLFLLVGVSGLMSCLRTALRASGTVAQPVLPGVPTLPSALASTPTVGGEVELKASASPAAKFFGMIFIALFWNGITSIFVTMAVRSWLRHRPEIFLSIFITPFVLIGLGLIGGVVYTFLGLFNPRLRLRVNATALPLGSTLQLRWQIAGAAGRIQRLRIEVEAREEATYRRGTRTSTDRSVFCRLPVIDTQDSQQIRSGAAQVELPRNLVPSWDGGSNRIVWELKARGEIPRYPDLDDTYPLKTLPPNRT